jgi:hypothetical protein
MSADAPRATAADRHTPGNGAEGEEGNELATNGSQAAAGDPQHLPGETRSDQRPSYAGMPGSMGTHSDTDDDFAAMLAQGRATGSGGDGRSGDGSSDLDTVPGHTVPGQANGGAPGTEPVLFTPDPGPAPVLTPEAPPAPPGPEGEERPGGRTRKPKRGGRGRQGRKVRQRLWAIDPWSVFKISVMFYACMFVIVLVAGTVLWNVARSAGTIDEAESFVTRLAAYGECVPEEEVARGTEFEEDDDCEEGTVLVDGFKINDGVIFKFAAITGAIFAIAGSAANVLMVVLLNLINEVSGGMRYTIIREPSGPKPPGRIKRAARSLRAQVRR